MDAYHQIAATLALTMGVAWASGINLYAAMFVLGWLGSTGGMVLPPGLEVLSHPGVMTAAGLMFCLEFFADKVPGLDSLWDAVHSFIRIPAGAILAAGAVGHVDPAIALSAGILGGGVTAVTHAAKAGSRVMINTSPEPFSNIGVSLFEDVMVIAGLWAALQHPSLFLGFLLLFLILLAILLPRIWRGIRGLWRGVTRWWKGEKEREEVQAAA